MFQEFLRIPGKGGNEQCEGDGLKRTYSGCCLENGEEEQREYGCSDYSPAEHKHMGDVTISIGRRELIKRVTEVVQWIKLGSRRKESGITFS